MKLALQLTVIVALLAVYGAAMFAVLHPHVSPAYRAFFIDRTATDYAPEHYRSTPLEGMLFSKDGLPDWVASTHGLSSREAGGRWTDADLGPTAGLTFTHLFSGNVCLEFIANAVPWLDGKDVRVRLGKQEDMLRFRGGGPFDYQLEFRDVKGAGRLDFLLPANLPNATERLPDSGDTRRLGVALSMLKMIPGDCHPEDNNHSNAQ